MGLPRMRLNRTNDETARLRILLEYQILDTASEKVYDDITRLVANICGTPIAALSFFDRRREWFKSVVGLEFRELPRGIALCTQSQGAEPIVITDTTKDKQFLSNPLVVSEPFIRFYAGVPLVNDEELTLGWLSVMDRTPRILNELQMDILRALGHQTMALLDQRRRMAQLEQATMQRQRYQRQLEETNAKLELLSMTDDLTGLGNRRAFDEYIEHEVQRANRYQRPLSIMLMDVDNFKLYNDTFGHLAGDSLLKAIAGLLNKKTRASDLIIRYGGDEFAVILPDTEKSAAKILAERFRKAVEGVSTLKRPVTVSIGVFSMRPGCLDSTKLVAEADKALYLAKESGRNQICHADDAQVR